MKLINWVVAPRPCERRGGQGLFQVFLKLVRRHQLGGLILTHYVTNPHERPDHVLERAGRTRAPAPDEPGATRWAVHRLTTGEVATLERLSGDPQQEHVVVLTDRGGHVITQEFCTQAEAEAAMTTAERSSPEAARRAEEERSFALSGYEYPGDKPGVRVVVGWNRYLETHYAEVWDDTDREGGRLLHWVGVGREEVRSVHHLAGVVQPYGEIPDHIFGCLEVDDENRCRRR